MSDVGDGSSPSKPGGNADTSDSMYTEPLTDGVKMAFTNLGSGTIRYAVRHDGDTVHSIDDGIDLLGSHQKRSTFVNRVHKALNGTDVDADAVEAELRQWFSDMNETSAEEKREHFMSDTAREIIDGTESVTVYAGESSIWEVKLLLWGSTESLEFDVSDIGKDSGGALEHAILNYWQEIVELSGDDWKAIRDHWVEVKHVREVHERTADSIADAILRGIARSVQPVSDRELLANDPAAAWYDDTNATGYATDDAPTPDGPLLWVQDEFLMDQLEVAGRKVEYKGQLVKELIRRGDVYGRRARRRWGAGEDNRIKVYPFDPERLGIDIDDINDGDTGPASEVEA